MPPGLFVDGLGCDAPERLIRRRSFGAWPSRGRSVRGARETAALVRAKFRPSVAVRRGSAPVSRCALPEGATDAPETDLPVSCSMPGGMDSPRPTRRRSGRRTVLKTKRDRPHRASSRECTAVGSCVSRGVSHEVPTSALLSAPITHRPALAATVARRPRVAVVSERAKRLLAGLWPNACGASSRAGSNTPGLQEHHRVGVAVRTHELGCARARSRDLRLAMHLRTVRPWRTAGGACCPYHRHS